MRFAVDGKRSALEAPRVELGVVEVGDHVVEGGVRAVDVMSRMRSDRFLKELFGLRSLVKGHVDASTVGDDAGGPADPRLDGIESGERGVAAPTPEVDAQGLDPGAFGVIGEGLGAGREAFESDGSLVEGERPFVVVFEWRAQDDPAQIAAPLLLLGGGLEREDEFPRLPKSLEAHGAIDGVNGVVEGVHAFTSAWSPGAEFRTKEWGSARSMPSLSQIAAARR